MELRPLGRSGVSVSQFCLGAMMFGAWGNTDDVDGEGESEEIVGKALAGGRRDDVVLATKFHNPMGEDPNRRGNSRRWIMRAVEDSLRRLDTDWIDLYQVHRPEPATDIEETLSALTELVHQGKVRYIGSSTFPASQIVEARSWRPSGRPATSTCSGSSPSNRPTRSSYAASRPTSFPPARATAWPSLLQPAGRRLAVG